MSYHRIGTIPPIDPTTGLPNYYGQQDSSGALRGGSGMTGADVNRAREGKDLGRGAATGSGGATTPKTGNPITDLLNSVFGGGSSSGGGSTPSTTLAPPAAKRGGITLPLIGTIPTWLALAGAAVIGIVVIKKLKGGKGGRKRNPGRRRRRRLRVRRRRRNPTYTKSLRGQYHPYGPAKWSTGGNQAIPSQRAHAARQMARTLGVRTPRGYSTAALGASVRARPHKRRKAR